MKIHTECLIFETKTRKETIHITDRIEQVVRRSGVQDGLCFVSPMHITAAIYVNDDESGLIEDMGNGSRNWPLNAPIASVTRPAKTTQAPTGKPCSCNMKFRYRSPAASSTSAPDSASCALKFDGERRKRAFIRVLGVA